MRRPSPLMMMFLCLVFAIVSCSNGSSPGASRQHQGDGAGNGDTHDGYENDQTDDAGGAEFDRTPVNITRGRLKNSQNPAWISPFRTLVFTGNPSGERLELYSIDIDGTSFSRLFGDDEHDFVNLPGRCWCERNNRLVISTDKAGHDDIWVVDLSTKAWTQVTNDIEKDYEPSWSGDCEWIAFQSRRGGNWDIYKIRADGTSLTRLTAGPSQEWGPNWSPSGGRIAFQSDMDGIWRIYTMTEDGSDVRAISQAGREGTDPSWSPDGSRIIYSGDGAAEGSEDIYSTDINTGEKVNLTDHTGYAGAPSWSPDGRFVAFEADWAGQKDIYIMQVAR